MFTIVLMGVLLSRAAGGRLRMLTQPSARVRAATAASSREAELRRPLP